MTINEVINKCEAMREEEEGVGLSDAFVRCIEFAYQEGKKEGHLNVWENSQNGIL
tara:strand:- start:637 stop:801 length:165 start_codon:yes stop_codon:yes gene_type:complete